jgi:hypothetical protein
MSFCGAAKSFSAAPKVIVTRLRLESRRQWVFLMRLKLESRQNGGPGTAMTVCPRVPDLCRDSDATRQAPRAIVATEKLLAASVWGRMPRLAVLSDGLRLGCRDDAVLLDA